MDTEETENDGDGRKRICLSLVQSEMRGGSTGIKCPDCDGTWFRVVRTTQKADKIVRRRACRRCGREILTTERLTG